MRYLLDIGSNGPDLNTLEIIARMKGSSRNVSMQMALPIADSAGRVIGMLVPMGHWAWLDNNVVECFRDWRQRFMRMFFVRFESSSESTIRYLRDLAVGSNDRLMFLMLDVGGRIVGHVGIANISQEQCELDNLIRGVGGGEPRLIYYAELAILRWCFQVLGVKKVDARVISYNWMAKALHEEVGFQLISQFPLKRRDEDDMVFHDIVQESEANVQYTCDVLTISPQDIAGVLTAIDSAT